jgi:hypothetical protein
MSENFVGLPVDGLTESGNAVVSRTVKAPPEFVWSVLADGWMYATWVVGASRIREVDPDWPATGSRIHHSFGIWPTLIDDNTEVLKSVGTGPVRELVLQARGWPAGEAQVRLLIAPAPADHSTVSIVEDVTNGPGTLIPRAARQLVIVPRNKETLQRLALIAEGRYRESAQAEAGAGISTLRAR